MSPPKGKKQAAALLFTLSGDDNIFYTLKNKARIILVNSLVISLKPGNWEHLGAFGNIKRTG